MQMKQQASCYQARYKGGRRGRQRAGKKRKLTSNNSMFITIRLIYLFTRKSRAHVSSLKHS